MHSEETAWDHAVSSCMQRNPHLKLYTFPPRNKAGVCLKFYIEPGMLRVEEDLVISIFLDPLVNICHILRLVISRPDYGRFPTDIPQ